MPQSTRRWLVPLLLFSLFAACKTNTFLSDLDTQRITVDKNAQSTVDSTITAMISPYKSKLDAQMGRVIGRVTVDLKKSKPESTLGNWMTDIIHERASYYYGQPVDFAIQNYGGIRVPAISAGEITVRHIYELMPFDNKIVILEMKADVLNQMMAHIAEGGGWPISSTVKMVINPDKQIQELTINGKAVEKGKTYLMALPDYVANGGGGCDFLQTLVQIETGWNVREAIIDYLDTYKDPMTAQLDKRIVKMEPN